MLILRIKQAECALADGRLDEAFELVQTEDIRRHQRGQKLLGEVARALAARGQNHLAAQRLQQALTDCNKADKLAGSLPETAELRSAICRAMEQKQHKHQQRSQKLAQAKENMENGWLSVGEQILADASEVGDGADALLQRAAAIRLQIDAVVANAEKALQRNDLEAAIDIVQKVDAGQTQNSRLTEITARIRSLANKRIDEALVDGRIHLADCLLRRLGTLAAESIETTELSLAVAQCRDAAQLAASGKPRLAAQLLQKVKAVVPSARWLDAAIDQAQRATGALDGLRTGPLGLAVCNAQQVSEHQANSQNENAPSLQENGRRSGSDSDKAPSEPRYDSVLPSRFVLQVDGVGSFLVLRGQSITVGPISSSGRPVLSLLADPHLPVATIERTDGDYFIRSRKPIYLNDKLTTEKLLADGDRIALSARCQLRFQLPNAASTTGVLMLSSARLARPDINHIILMDRDILMGPGSNQHIRTSGGNTVTFLIREGRLSCRAKENITVNGRPFDLRQGLPMDTPIKIGEISLVLAKLRE